jgi:hypothetical protein
MKGIRLLTVIFAILLIAQEGLAQKYLNKNSRGFYQRAAKRNLLLTLGSGTSHYYGDLAAPNDHTNIKPTISFGARLRFADNFYVGSDLTWFMLRGDDAKDPLKEPRNLSFQSHNFEANLTFQVQLFPENSFTRRKFANPYAYGGVGIMQFNPTAEYNGTRYALRPLRTEGIRYGSFAAAFPIGAGVRFRINPYFNISLDGGYRFLTTDYMDDVSSGIYPNPNSFDDPIARELSDRSDEYGIDPPYSVTGANVRGNPDNMDGYFLFNIRLEYYLAQVKLPSKSYGRRIKPYRPKNRPKYNYRRPRYYQRRP